MARTVDRPRSAPAPPHLPRSRVRSKARMRNVALGEVARDLWLAARRLRQRPGLTLPAIAILALAIGAGAAGFSLVEAGLLPPPPRRHPARPGVLWEGHSLPHRLPRVVVASAT